MGTWPYQLSHVLLGDGVVDGGAAPADAAVALEALHARRGGFLDELRLDGIVAGWVEGGTG